VIPKGTEAVNLLGPPLGGRANKIMKSETFKMFCLQCGKAYQIKATTTNPVCKKCNPGRLDFERKPKKEVQK
jgi:DNA-directed RNA polymerase subunit RPC12/RpoP